MNKALAPLSLIIGSCLLLLASAAAQAKINAPAPASKKESLADMQADLERHKKEKAIMDKGLSSLKKELETNQKKLIDISQSIQKNEQALIGLETDIRTHTQEKDKLAKQLQADKEIIVQLILAMERLEHIPMAALAVRPGAPLETAQSALLIEDIGKSLTARTAHLKKNTQRFQTLLSKLEDNHAALERKTATLEKDRSDLQAFLEKKEKLYKRSQKDVANKAAIINRISKESTTMKELLANLAEQRAEEQRQAQLKPRKIAFSPPPLSLKGRDNSKFGMPVAGIIRVKYGGRDHLDAPSKGLWLEGHHNGLVVAPMAGTIRFVGQFKSYGNIVIIEHKHGYHSLIAGLERINVGLDHQVAGGEPLGTLGGADQQGKGPMIYFELRKSGKAIDPATKFGKLSNN